MKAFIFFIISATALCTHAQLNEDFNISPDGSSTLRKADGGNDQTKTNPGQNFPNFPQQFPNGFPGFPPSPFFQPMPFLTPEEIRNLKPGDGSSVVSASSVSSSSSVKTVNGVTVEESSEGRAVTNENGNVTDVSYGVNS